MSGTDTPIRVLLADDHAVVREGIGLILSVEDDVEVVGQVSDGAQAAAFVAEHPVDVVLMDIQMPGTDGIEATRHIVASGAACGVVMLTTFEREDYLFDAITAGASGFLLKNAEPEVLVDAVRAVHAGQALLAPEVTLKVLRRVAQDAGASAGAGAAPSSSFTASVPPSEPAAPAAPSSPSASPRAQATPPASPGPAPSGTGTLPDLTPREHDVLALLAEGMSNQEIAAALFVSEATVKTHLSNVLAKLGARDRAQAIVAAFRLGIASA
ncbi:MAG: response regulator transcription factor [Arthrobacter sp.]|jgi:DNA-binding NarL/FixJ family response regulator|nr:response regulator transcription factor [Arthrobacter sp.]